MVANSPVKVLVVDDERPVRRFLFASLHSHYEFFEADSGRDALQVAAVHPPDVVLLDLGLPDMDGTEVVRSLREWTGVPIIIISVRDSEQDKVAALDAGADDYLAKPFGMNELLARIRVALRRSDQMTPQAGVYRNNELLVDLSKREVRMGARRVILTPTEYDILHALVDHVGKVLTHQQLIRLVWGSSAAVDMHLLRVNISNLRRKIEPDPLRPQYIITESGIGYRLRENELPLGSFPG